MKKYKAYMDGIQAPDTLRQRLAELEEPGARPVPWKKYGAVAAALVLATGLGAWGLGRFGWDGLAANYRPDAIPEVTGAEQPDIAREDPGAADPLGEKTLGGYEVRGEENGPETTVAYYVLPYIEYGEVGRVASMADWDIPAGTERRNLNQEEIIALMGGGDAVNVHLDWGGYELSGWAAWYGDGSFWGAYIDGRHTEWSDTFEFAVTAGQLPPTCFVYPSSVTQEIRGLTVTADKYDWELGEESLTWIPERRVSFFKDNWGYRFVMTSGDTGSAEEMVSRLVRQIADRGLALWTVDPNAAYVCPDCGQTVPADTKHSHTSIGGDIPAAVSVAVSTEPLPPETDAPVSASAAYICGICGQALPAQGRDPESCYTCPICGMAFPNEHAGHDPVLRADTPYACDGEHRPMCSGVPVPPTPAPEEGAIPGFAPEYDPAYEDGAGSGEPEEDVCGYPLAPGHHDEGHH